MCRPLRSTADGAPAIPHSGNASLDGSTRTPEFLAINPIGNVPTVQLEDGRFLAESDAILLHFA